MEDRIKRLKTMQALMRESLAGKHAVDRDEVRGNFAGSAQLAGRVLDALYPPLPKPCPDGT
ncbi:MAG: hypothetical protein ACYCT1_08510 [Steroidobacteraceae bacterium]